MVGSASGFCWEKGDGVAVGGLLMFWSNGCKNSLLLRIPVCRLRAKIDQACTQSPATRW